MSDAFEMDEVGRILMIESLKKHVIPVETLSSRCNTMATVPLEMFDREVSIVSYEIVKGDAYDPSYTHVVYNYHGMVFQITQYFGDSVDTDPWMGEGYLKRSQLLKWLLESITLPSRLPNLPVIVSNSYQMVTQQSEQN